MCAYNIPGELFTVNWYSYFSVIIFKKRIWLECLQNEIEYIIILEQVANAKIQGMRK